MDDAIGEGGGGEGGGGEGGGGDGGGGDGGGGSGDVVPAGYDESSSAQLPAKLSEQDIKASGHEAPLLLTLLDDPQSVQLGGVLASLLATKHAKPTTQNNEATSGTSARLPQSTQLHEIRALCWAASCADFALAVLLAYPLDLRSISAGCGGGLHSRARRAASARGRGAPGRLRLAHGDRLLVAGTGTTCCRKGCGRGATERRHLHDENVLG